MVEMLLKPSTEGADETFATRKRAFTEVRFQLLASIKGFCFMAASQRHSQKSVSNGIHPKSFSLGGLLRIFLVAFAKVLFSMAFTEAFFLKVGRKKGYRPPLLGESAVLSFFFSFFFYNVAQRVGYNVVSVVCPPCSPR